jgi:hypothetical protein
MASSFEHRALVEQLRALTSKRAENPGEKLLNTSHPSGNNSAADDHTQPAVVGHRYQENSKDNKTMYPAGTDSDNKNEAGSEQKDPGNNKGLHPRPSGEAPEVERKYNLNDHNDPGTSHPSGKAAQDFINEARGLAAEIRNLIKASAGDAYVTGEAPEVATENVPDNAKGTSEYPVNAENDGNIEIPENAGKNAAEKLAVLRAQATLDMRKLQEHMKESAERDAQSFVTTVVGIMDKFAMPHVAPVVAQAKQAQEVAVKNAAVNDAVQKIAIFDALAQIDGTAKFAEVMEAMETGSAPEKKKKPDADGDGVPNWADNMNGEDDNAAESKEAFAKALHKLANEIASEGGKKGSRNGGTFRKRAEEDCEEVEDSVDEDPEEDTSEGEEAAAEEVLADMAAMPAESPDAAMMGMDPAMMMGGADTAEGQLGPEEEAALMALMQQEGMKESDVKAYAKIASALASGKLNPNKLSQAEKAFIAACDTAVKTAGAKFQTLRSASRLRNELNSIYRGIK